MGVQKVQIFASHPVPQHPGDCNLCRGEGNLCLTMVFTFEMIVSMQFEIGSAGSPGSIGDSLSETLQQLRLEKGLTPLQLAKISGINLLTINLYENPYYEQYELKTLARIVESCGGKLTLTVSSDKS